MKLALRAALVALALTSGAAQAATFSVPLEGWWKIDGYGGCVLPPPGDPSSCERGDMAGVLLTVTTTSGADGVYLDSSFSAIVRADTPLLSMVFSADESPDPQFEVWIQGGRVASIFGWWAAGSHQIAFTGRTFSYEDNPGHIDSEIQAILVPEPASGVLLLAGLAGIIVRRRAIR